MTTIYLETSFISYLCAKPSTDPRIRMHQKSTRRWWETERENYSLLVSEAVLQELSRGDPVAAARRMEYVKSIPSLVETNEIKRFSGILFKESGLPHTAEVDATHIACAVIADVDLLLTWNMAHINNPFFKIRMRRVCAKYGCSFPEICTPEELLGDEADER